MILQTTQGSGAISLVFYECRKELPTYQQIHYYRDMAIYGNGNLSQGHLNLLEGKVSVSRVTA